MANPEVCRLLALYYERGIITERDLVNRLVDAAATVPPTELVPAITAEIVERIQEYAAAPRDTEWVQICPICNGPGWTPEKHEADMKQHMAIFLEGLDRWREYFGFAG